MRRHERNLEPVWARININHRAAMIITIHEAKRRPVKDHLKLANKQVTN